MKRLEDIIRNNAEAFNSDEPSANHFGKFMEKLDAKQIRKKRDKLIKTLTNIAAAAAVILLIFSIVLLRKTPVPEEKAKYTLSTEVKEIEMYYTAKINDNLQAMNPTLKKCPVQRKNLNSSFRELDKSFESIQNDLRENPQDERVINALVMHYQTKLEVLSQISKQSQKNCI